MEINLSIESINTIYNSLKNSKRILKQQMVKENSIKKQEIFKNQLAEVEEVLNIFEELTQ